MIIIDAINTLLSAYFMAGLIIGITIVQTLDFGKIHMIDQFINEYFPDSNEHAKSLYKLIINVTMVLCITAVWIPFMFLYIKNNNN